MEDYSFSALRLGLFIDQDIDSSQFRCMKHARSSWQDLNIEMESKIIGSSHCLQWKHGGETLFTEVLACVDTNSSDNYRDLAAVHQAIEIEHPTFDYRFTHKLRAYDKFYTRIERWRQIQEQEADVFLCYQFDSPQIDKFARTIISLRRNEQQMHIQTVHEYPEENMMVLTNSDLRFKHLG